MRSALVALACGAALWWAAPAASAAGAHRAAVIVDTGAGVHRVVIAFTEDSITGTDALQRAGAEPVVRGYAGQGGAVCALYGVGHPADASCLGTGDDPRYWAYFRAPAGTAAFSYAAGCACTARVHDGDVEGWRYGTGAAPAYASVGVLAGDPPVATGPTAAATAPTEVPSSPSALTGGPTGGAAGVQPGAVAAPGPAEAGGTGSTPTPTSTRTSTSPGRAEAASRRISSRTGGGDGGGGSAASLTGLGAVLGVLTAGIVVARRARSKRTANAP